MDLEKTIISLNAENSIWPPLSLYMITWKYVPLNSMELTLKYVCKDLQPKLIFEIMLRII